MSWQQIVVVLMPRKSQIEDLTQTRALCLINTFATWYMMTLLILAEEDFEAKEHSLNLFGFRKHRKVHEITAGLKQVVRHSIEWGKDDSLHLGLADVKHAFETMTFERAASSMERVGIQAKRRLAILSCLIDNHGVVNFSGHDVRGNKMGHDD